ncbi:MAG TPA: DUF4873 domain-containing protein [Streptosporangiaceae bacterium]|nr:DUF4873 domain-containing protein [Streptosporangiaceae bacterium]
MSEGAGAPDDGYSGPATLTIDDVSLDVQVELRGHFEPIDGRYHWYGRIASNESLAELLAGAKASGVLLTSHGRGPCEVSEPDTWQRYRVTGYSTPPFRLSAPDWGAHGSLRAG